MPCSGVAHDRCTEGSSKHAFGVYLHDMQDQVLEDLVYHSLEGCSGVLQSERHHLIAVDSPIGKECHLVFVWWMHLDLIISGVGIHKPK